MDSITTNEEFSAPHEAVVEARPIWRRWLWPGVGLGIVLVFLGLLTLGLRTAGVPGPQAGQPAPDFSLTLFDGKPLSLRQDLAGKVVVVNFWASWCTPCRDEAKLLEQTWQDYRNKGVVFVGINYVDTEPEARAYIQEYHNTYPNGPDLGSKISHQYRVQGVPETFVIDKQGNIVGLPAAGTSSQTPKFTGPVTANQLAALLDQLTQAP
ncbi:MAG: TlpA family protein disulfide reductase [Chloroflexi bacterium]|nr:TlpA family protein disulfide reductase [Chloroflexota bacterium]